MADGKDSIKRLVDALDCVHRVSALMARWQMHCADGGPDREPAGGGRAGPGQGHAERPAERVRHRRHHAHYPGASGAKCLPARQAFYFVKVHVNGQDAVPSHLLIPPLAAACRMPWDEPFAGCADW